MQHGLAGREVPARQDELLSQHALRGLDPDDGAHSVAVGHGAAQVDVHLVARVAAVAQQGDPAVVVRVDDVQVAVPAQVPEGGAEAHPSLVQAPGRAGVLELQVAQVSQREMLLYARGARIHDPDPVGRTLGAHHPGLGVDAGIPREPVRHE